MSKIKERRKKGLPCYNYIGGKKKRKSSNNHAKKKQLNVIFILSIELIMQMISNILLK